MFFCCVGLRNCMVMMSVLHTQFFSTLWCGNALLCGKSLASWQKALDAAYSYNSLKQHN